MIIVIIVCCLQDSVFQDLGEGILENAQQVNITVSLLGYFYFPGLHLNQSDGILCTGLQRHLAGLWTDRVWEELFHGRLRAEQRPGPKTV